MLHVGVQGDYKSDFKHLLWNNEQQQTENQDTVTQNNSNTFFLTLLNEVHHVFQQWLFKQ
jgi:hypothetical protein